MVEGAVGGDDAAVVFEGLSLGKIEGFSVEVGDASAGGLDDGESGGVVPDFFLVAFFHGEAEVEGGGAVGDGGVFGLAVHAKHVGGDAEVLDESGGAVVGGVGAFHGFAEAGVGQVDFRAGTHLAGRGAFAGPHPGFDARAAAEDDAGVAGVDFVAGAAEHAEQGRAVFDQGEGDGVLAAAQESLGAVDGVEGPEGSVSPGVIAEVEEIEQGVFIDLGVEACGEARDAGHEVGIVAEVAGALFGHDAQIGGEAGEAMKDEGLAGVVGDGDGGAVLLGLFVADAHVLGHGLAATGGFPDGGEGGGEKIFVVHERVQSDKVAIAKPIRA